MDGNLKYGTSEDADDYMGEMQFRRRSVDHKVRPGRQCNRMPCCAVRFDPVETYPGCIVPPIVEEVRTFLADLDN